MAKTLLKGVGISGYRSFGNGIQKLDGAGPVNLIVGQNNSGKSNLLRFICDVFPRISAKKDLQLGQLDRYQRAEAEFLVAYPLAIESDDRIAEMYSSTPGGDRLAPVDLSRIRDVLRDTAKAQDSDYTWFVFDKSGSPSTTRELVAALRELGDREILGIWNHWMNRSGGSRDAHWEPEVLNRLFPKLPEIKTAFIPAFRQIGSHVDGQRDFSGKGIIGTLAELQEPSLERYERDIEKFRLINQFLKAVLDNDSAELRVPHDREMIVVHMDGIRLPLESLGTGIHEVIIIAVAATTLEETVICMEEPELHLNPILQKKLLRYLIDETSNQYFISTHSSAFLNHSGIEIFQTRLSKGATKIRHVTTDSHKSEVCEDLGYLPSDLIQSNCVIWVEGPSDRLYLQWWIRNLDPELFEGEHFVIMFYGGRLSSHLSGENESELIEDFIELRRLNRRGVILIDSDKSSPAKRINATKERLKKEFNQGPGFAWITKGREIENYVGHDQLAEAVEAMHPSFEPANAMDVYDNCLKIKKKKGKKVVDANKVKIAAWLVDNHDPDLSKLDLEKNMKKLVQFIRASNKH